MSVLCHQGVRLLAECCQRQIQAIVHAESQLFGIQFQPELYELSHRGGWKTLENFFKIAGIIT